MQLDNFSELPKDKRPPDKLIWDGTIEDIESWLDKVLKNKQEEKVTFSIPEEEIEG